MIFVGSERHLLHRVMRAVCGAIGTLAASAMVASTIALAMMGTPAAALAQDFTVDSAASDGLTNYLRQNRLPLVGAQIGKAPARARRLVLYGYVATQQGKSDAESKAVAYMGAPPPEVVDRIVVQPEIAKMKAGGDAGSSGASSGTPDNSQSGDVGDYSASGSGAGGVALRGAFPGESIDQVIGDIQRYGIKSPPVDQAP
jgi:hypothetical protein